jgi:hypothetical protein
MTITQKHHIASYNGKNVVMDYIDNPKQEFRYACMRIIDNGANGIVICPDGKRYEVLQSTKTAKLIK